ncbi:MAG: TetR/AcrR family transcriptional regulator [Bacteroidia bacterium]|nr:TetR/AcrR family transcriptional regulator [Bacteroidia bacterium]
MPKKTFLKLDKEKRDRFIQIALEEFARHNYENASLNQIAARLQIAKGSIYRYFENKKDLFFYLMEHANRKKQESIAEVFKQHYANFFEMFEKIYEAATRFDLMNPLYSHFLHNIAQERNSEELGNLNLLTKKQGMEYYRGLLRREQANGIIRQDIDLDLMAFG